MVFHHFHQGDEAVLCVENVRVHVKVALASTNGESLVIRAPSGQQTLLLMWQGERWVAVLDERRINLEPKLPMGRRYL